MLADGLCLQSTIPAILGAVAKVLNSGEEAAAQEVLENLVEIAEAHPRFLRKQLPDVVQATLVVRIPLVQPCVHAPAPITGP